MQLNTTICKENTDYLGFSGINVAQMDYHMLWPIWKEVYNFKPNLAVH